MQGVLREAQETLSKISKRQEKPMDHWDAFGKYIVESLRIMSEEKQKKCRDRILMAIMDIDN